MSHFWDVWDIRADGPARCGLEAIPNAMGHLWDKWDMGPSQTRRNPGSKGAGKGPKAP